MLDNPAAPELAPARQTSINKSHVFILAIVLVAVLAFGVRTGRLFFVEGLSAPSLEGTYTDRSGVKVEFANDGNLLITDRGSSTTNIAARWSHAGDDQIKLEPAQLEVLAQTCGYRFGSYGALAITGCEFKTELFRVARLGLW